MPPEPTVLAFDTSAAHCAAALLSGDRVLAERFEIQSRGQAERLFPLIEEMLADVNKGWVDIDCIGVGIGPGNFTGIRISVAAARGLALSLGVPTVGVSALEALAEGLDGTVVSVVDGRRGQFYVQVFGVAGQDAPSLCNLDSLPAIPSKTPASVVGHEAALIAGRCGGRFVDPAFPLAVAIARIAARRGATTTQRPAPLYIRTADAAPSSDPPPLILP